MAVDPLARAIAGKALTRSTFKVENVLTRPAVGDPQTFYLIPVTGQVDVYEMWLYDVDHWVTFGHVTLNPAEIVTVVAQTFTSAQQAIARVNINAASLGANTFTGEQIMTLLTLAKVGTCYVKINALDDEAVITFQKAGVDVCAISCRSAGTNDNDLTFNMRDDNGAWTQPLFIERSTGNIGVNKNDPQHALDIFGTLRATNILLGNAQVFTNAGGTLVGALKVTSGGVETTSVGTDSFISYPSGGHGYFDGAQTGLITVVLPVARNQQSVISFDILVGNYLTGAYVEYKIKGYNTTTWGYPSCKTFSADDIANLPVRFGYNGSKIVVCIGDVSTSWSSVTVQVTNVNIDYAGNDFNIWKQGWSITLGTTLPSVVDSTITNHNTYTKVKAQLNAITDAIEITNFNSFNPDVDLRTKDLTVGQSVKIRSFEATGRPVIDGLTYHSWCGWLLLDNTGQDGTARLWKYIVFSDALPTAETQELFMAMSVYNSGTRTAWTIPSSSTHTHLSLNTIEITNFDTFNPDTDARTKDLTIGQSVSIWSDAATGRPVIENLQYQDWCGQLLLVSVSSGGIKFWKYIVHTNSDPLVEANTLFVATSIYSEGTREAWTMPFSSVQGNVNKLNIEAIQGTSIPETKLLADVIPFSEYAGDLSVGAMPANLVPFGGVVTTGGVVVVGGFSNTKYLNALNVFTYGSSVWEKYGTITTASDVTTEQWFMSTKDDFKGMMVGLKLGKVYSLASSTGSSWNIMDETSGLSTVSILANTSYNIRFGFTGTNYYVDLKVTGSSTWVSYLNVTSSLPITDYTAQYGTLGQPAWVGDFHFFGGINFNGSYLKVGGVILRYASTGDNRILMTGTGTFKGSDSNKMTVATTAASHLGVTWALDGNYSVIAYNNVYHVIRTDQIFIQKAEPAQVIHNVWIDNTVLPAVAKMWGGSDWGVIVVAKCRTTFNIIGNAISDVSVGEFGIRTWDKTARVLRYFGSGNLLKKSITGETPADVAITSTATVFTTEAFTVPYTFKVGDVVNFGLFLKRSVSVWDTFVVKVLNSSSVVVGQAAFPIELQTAYEGVSISIVFAQDLFVPVGGTVNISIVSKDYDGTLRISDTAMASVISVDNVIIG